jgi:hypothetical protein
MGCRRVSMSGSAVQGSSEVQQGTGAVKRQLWEIQVRGQSSIMREAVKRLVYGGSGANWGVWVVNGGVLTALVACPVVSG